MWPHRAHPVEDGLVAGKIGIRGHRWILDRLVCEPRSAPAPAPDARDPARSPRCLSRGRGIGDRLPPKASCPRPSRRTKACGCRSAVRTGSWDEVLQVKANACPRAGGESTWGRSRRSCADDGRTGVRRDGVGAKHGYDAVLRSCRVSSGNVPRGKVVSRRLGFLLAMACKRWQGRIGESRGQGPAGQGREPGVLDRHGC